MGLETTKITAATADMSCGYCCRCIECQCTECQCCACDGCRCPT